MLNRILRRGIREISKVIASPEVGYPILIDYPVTPKVRQGWGKPPHREIDALLKKHEGNFRHLLEEGRKLGPWLDKIDSASQGLEPFWSNIWFTGLDAMALYTMLATNKPAQLIEIGSGNSTKFARRAIKDHALPTRIISIDPQPRAEIDALCDEFVRAPLEDSVENLAQRLKAGDILFFDGSHRSFQNSDVTVFFLEVLPRLAAGVIVHIHDIFLPNDYPEQWAARYYSEQYVLAAWLLGGGAGSEILFASAYVGLSETLRQPVESLAGAAYQRGLTHNLHATGGAKGVSFWLKIGPR